LLIVIGVLFKLALFPFHYWVADVYEGSALIITAFFSTVPKIAFVCLFLKLYFIFFSVPYLSILVLISAAASILYGTLVALYQTKMRRFLAYGAIAHMGFIILAIGLHTVSGAVAGLFYLLSYIFLSLIIFSILLCFKGYNVASAPVFVDNVIDLIKALKTNRFVLLIFCISLFSIAGIPPLAGFFGK
jgi:NADH-quinone oxidoreductase subunit N